MAPLSEATGADILGSCIRASYSTALRCLSFLPFFVCKSMLFCFILKCNILIRIRTLEISISCQTGCQASVSTSNFLLVSHLGFPTAPTCIHFSSYSSPRKSNHITVLHRGRRGVGTALKSGDRVRRSGFDHCPRRPYTVSLDTQFPFL